MRRERPQGSEDIAIVWYGVALVTYILAGFFLQSVLLNWLVGPLFLLAVLHVIPTAVRNVMNRMRSAK